MVTAPFTEFADHPGAGRTYAETRRAGIDTVAPTGRVRLDAIARWLQDLAYRDLVDAGWARPAPWFVRRLRIRAERFPVFTERIELTTWCSGLGPSVAERRTSVRGAEGAAVEAVAQWISVDPETARPAPLDEAFRATYAPSAAGRRSRARAPHPSPPPRGAAPPPARPAGRRGRAPLRLPRERPRRGAPRQQRRLLGPARGGARRPSAGRA